MRERKNALEWSVFALSVALIALTIGTLAIDAARGGATPDLAVELGAPIPHGNDFLVRVDVHNRGSGSAEKVRVHIGSDNGVAQDLELDFVPRSSKRSAYVVLQRAPNNLRAQVSGWVEP